MKIIDDSLKDLDIPQLFFELLGEYMVPKALKIDESDIITIENFAKKNNDNSNDINDYGMNNNEVKMDDNDIELIKQKAVKVYKHEHYSQILMAIVKQTFNAINTEFIDPINETTSLQSNGNGNINDNNTGDSTNGTNDETINNSSDKPINDTTEVKVDVDISDALEQKINEYKLALHKLSALITFLKPFVIIENLLYVDANDNDKNGFWTPDKSVKFNLDCLMNNTWKFAMSISLIKLDDEVDSQNKRDLSQFFPNNFTEISFDLFNSSIITITDIIRLISIDFGETSCDYFKLDQFLLKHIQHEVQFTLKNYQTSVSLDTLSKTLTGLFDVTLILLQNNTKFYSDFMEYLTKFEYGMKAFSIVINTLILNQNIPDSAINIVETFINNWLIFFLNTDQNDTDIMRLSTNKTTNQIESDSYKSVEISLRSMLSNYKLSKNTLISSIKTIINYLDNAIKQSKNNALCPGITRDKSHCIIKSLTKFLEKDWKDKDLECLQYNIVLKLFTLCFSGMENDAQNLSEVCEFIFKKVIKKKSSKYFELLKHIAMSLKIPWFFTNNATNEIKNAPKYYEFNNQKLEIGVNRNRNRWTWCLQVLILMQATTFEQGIQLIDILLDKDSIIKIFSLGLNNDKSSELVNYGVTLKSLQSCRDVVCDLVDLVGSGLILHKPSPNKCGKLTDNDLKNCNRIWLIYWLLCFEEKLSWLPLSTLPDNSITDHVKSWKYDKTSDKAVMNVFSKPRHFTSILKLLFDGDNVDINYINQCLSYIIENKQCDISIKSRVIGYFVNVLHNRDNIDELQIIVTKLFNFDTINGNESQVIDNLKLMRSVFIVFPDLIGIGFIRKIIVFCNEKASVLQGYSDNNGNNDMRSTTKDILKILKLLVEIIAPINCIALNISGNYTTPNNIEYNKSKIWVKHKEYLVGVLFELFSYINTSFEWYLTKMDDDFKSGNETDNDFYTDSQFDNDILFWYSNLLTLISYSLVLINSDGDKDVFFDLDWNGLIFNTNFILDHVLHQRNEFIICLSSFLDEFYQFYLTTNTNNDDTDMKENNIELISNINDEFRSVMMTLYNSMGVIRQIASRSTDLTGRKNIKKKNFIFESLELLIELIGNEIWRNILSIEALASPYNKQSINELDIETLYINMAYVNKNFMIQSGLISKNISNIDNINMNTNNINVSQTYNHHIILDELYNSINDLLSHPTVMSPSIEQKKQIINNIKNNQENNNMLYLNQSLCDILLKWHHQLFDALASTHHQICGSAFRVLCISTKYYAINYLRSTSKGSSKSKTLSPSNNSNSKIEMKRDIDDVEIEYDFDDNTNDTNDTPDLISDNLSILSTNTTKSYAFSQTSNSRKKRKSKLDYASEQQKNQFKKVHDIINNIIPINYLLPHNVNSFVPTHCMRTWLLCWWLLLIMIEEIDLDLKLKIVYTMKHDNKYKSPIGSYALLIRELIENLYVIKEMQLSELIDQYNSITTEYVNKYKIILNKRHLNIFEYIFSINDLMPHTPNKLNEMNKNLLHNSIFRRSKWIYNNITHNIFSKNIYYSNISLKLYLKILNIFPSLTRYWLSNEIKDRITRDTISQITSQYFSPILLNDICDTKVINNQLSIHIANNITKSSEKKILEHLTFKSNKSEHQIIGIYKDEDNEVELSMIVDYSVDYPLKPLALMWLNECGLSTKKIKTLKMLMTGMLNNQNANIIETFTLWSFNISKYYQGIDECPICYSVIHPTKKTLPKIQCPTCKGKFHKYCIYKWTKTSQKNTCPLCRSFI